MLTDANRRWLPEAVMTVIPPHGRYKAGPPTADHNDNLPSVNHQSHRWSSRPGCSGARRGAFAVSPRVRSSWRPAAVVVEQAVLISLDLEIFGSGHMR